MLQHKIEESRSVTEEHVEFVLKHAVPNAVTVEEIERETEKDKLLQDITKLVREDWTSKFEHTAETETFKKVKQELCIAKGILLKGS